MYPPTTETFRQSHYRHSPFLTVRPPWFNTPCRVLQIWVVAGPRRHRHRYCQSPIPAGIALVHIGCVTPDCCPCRLRMSCCCHAPAHNQPKFARDPDWTSQHQTSPDIQTKHGSAFFQLKPTLSQSGLITHPSGINSTGFPSPLFNVPVGQVHSFVLAS